jgi:hypothetical protein
VTAASTKPTTPSATTGLARVLADITAEREAQHAVWGVQHHLPDGTGPQWSALANAARQECERAAANGELTWRHVLFEEVAEALAENDPTRLRGELTQAGAVVAQWMQAIDHRSLPANREGNTAWPSPPNSCSPATAKPPAT